MAIRKTPAMEDKAVLVTPAELAGIIKTVQDGMRADSEDMVRGIIPMNRAIDGVGAAGDVVTLPKSQAKAYQAKGYLHILED